MIPALAKAAEDARLRGRVLRVYVYLCHQLDFAVAHAVKPVYVARVLRMDRADVSRAITQLVDLGYLARGEADGHLRTYRLVYAVPAPGADRGDSPQLRRA